MAGNGGKYVVDVIPTLKKTDIMLKKTSEIAKKMGRTFGNVFQTAMGNTISGVLMNAVKGTMDEAKQAGEKLKSEFGRDKDISVFSQRMGVSSDRIDALSRLGQANGIDQQTIFSALETFRNNVQSGTAKFKGKDVLDQFVNALGFTRNQKNGFQKDYTAQTLFGSGINNLIYGKNAAGDFKDLNKTIDSLMGNTPKDDRLKLINQGANTTDAYNKQETLEDMKQRGLSGRVNQKDSLTAMLFEMRDQTKKWDVYTKDIKKFIDTAVVLQKAQEETNKLISAGLAKIIKLAEWFYKKWTGHGL